MKREIKEKKYLISDFDFLDTDTNKLYSRSETIVDYIQDGNILVKGNRMKRKYRKKFNREFCGSLGYFPFKAVVFDKKDIITSYKL